MIYLGVLFLQFLRNETALACVEQSLNFGWKTQQVCTIYILINQFTVSA